MGDKMKAITVIVGAVMLLVILGIITLLVLSDKDPTIILVSIPAIVASIGALLATNIVSKKVDTVQGQTNGTLSALREENKSLHTDKMALLAVATPEQISEAFNPDNPNLVRTAKH